MSIIPFPGNPNAAVRYPGATGQIISFPSLHCGTCTHFAHCFEESGKLLAAAKVEDQLSEEMAKLIPACHEYGQKED
jgi:hypothetical protein